LKEKNNLYCEKNGIENVDDEKLQEMEDHFYSFIDAIKEQKA